MLLATAPAAAASAASADDADDTLSVDDWPAARRSHASTWAPRWRAAAFTCRAKGTPRGLVGRIAKEQRQQNAGHQPTRAQSSGAVTPQPHVQRATRTKQQAWKVSWKASDPDACESQGTSSSVSSSSASTVASKASLGLSTVCPHATHSMSDASKSPCATASPCEVEVRDGLRVRDRVRVGDPHPGSNPGFGLGSG